MAEKEAAIIAIGSELTAGQITNRNAAWISDRLFSYGIGTRYHLTVEDRDEDILAALAFVKRDCAYVFCTGGLGPTSDDLTRDTIAKFAGVGLEYNQPSWDRIETFFRSLGREPAESNRQQCYFPVGATILTNEAGTANAFSLEHDGQTFFVLPGPPREIKRLWQDHIGEAIDSGEKWVIRKWRTIGKGESDLTGVVDAALADAPPGCEVAYRAHAPYVEIKLKYRQVDEDKFRASCRSLRSVLIPWLFEEDEESSADALAEYLQRFDNSVIDDTATHGYLTELLSSSLRSQGALKTSVLTSWDLTTDPEEYLQESLQLADDSHVALGVAGFTADHHYAVGMRTDSALEIEVFPSPYQGTRLLGRNQMAIAGLAIKTWVRWLAQNQDLPKTIS